MLTELWDIGCMYTISPWLREAHTTFKISTAEIAIWICSLSTVMCSVCSSLRDHTTKSQMSVLLHRFALGTGNNNYTYDHNSVQACHQKVRQGRSFSICPLLPKMMLLEHTLGTLSQQHLHDNIHIHIHWQKLTKTTAWDCSAFMGWQHYRLEEDPYRLERL